VLPILSRSVRKGGCATAVTDNYGYVRRTIPVRACDDEKKQQVPVRLPLVGTRSSLRAGSPLRSLRLASVGMTIQLGVLNLQGQNPRPNFAKDAKLGWGTLVVLLSLDLGHAPFSLPLSQFQMPPRSRLKRF
jgi:hypothetical protein